MGDTIDRLSKALASGASRRETLAVVVAGSAALLPWTTEGKSSRQQRRRRRKKRLLEKFAPYFEYCEDWCANQFNLGSKELPACINGAKTGKGPCYSEVDKGPGFICTKELTCPSGFECCPDILSPTGQCCVGGCQAINGTTICA